MRACLSVCAPTVGTGCVAQGAYRGDVDFDIVGAKDGLVQLQALEAQDGEHQRQERLALIGIHNDAVVGQIGRAVRATQQLASARTESTTAATVRRKGGGAART
jgi:hypothetical protein